MQKNLRLNVRIDHETAARLKALAAEQKRGMSEILREMIHEAPLHTEPKKPILKPGLAAGATALEAAHQLLSDLETLRDNVMQFAAELDRMGYTNAGQEVRDEILSGNIRKFDSKIAQVAEQAQADLAAYDSLRPEVRWFAARMEERLCANEHKGGWKNTSISTLISRLLANANSLRLAYYSKDRAKVLREAVDVANYAMMICDPGKDQE